MKYLASVLLVLSSATSYGQESFRKAFALREHMIFEGATTLVVKQDSVIPRTRLLIPLPNKDLKDNGKLLTQGGEITIKKGSATNSTTSFTIKKGSTIEVREVVRLLKEKQVAFAALSSHERDSLELVYPLGKKIAYTVERKLPAGKVLVAEEVVVDQKFREGLKLTKVVPVDTLPADEGYLKFDEDKIWVNPNLVDFKSNGLCYYQIKNRQTVKFDFTEFNVSALILPLKYRFGGKREGVSHEITSAVNVNGFIGHSWGRNTFHYREKVGNITNTSKWTLGGLFGASTVVLNHSNTSADDQPLAEGVERTKGLATLGGGTSYSFNKINVGLFVGVDFAVGNDASKWNYNKQAWAGLAVGYSLLPY